MKKSIMLLVLLSFIAGCATTNLNVFQKKSKSNIQYYCSSTFEVDLVGENGIHKAQLNFEFQKHNNYHSWFITTNDLDMQSYGLKTDRIQFYVDDQIFDLYNPSYVEKSKKQVQTDLKSHKNTYYLNENFFKKIICCDKILMHTITENGEFETTFSKQAIEDIGIFYQFIKINVIDNVSVIIR
ncbi:MAG: hypothetical protein HQ534_09730 [Armatimonadetes bacterium]|nr:hypothetical protein [Armatimonadota bacterium]